jgi:hypothetical protein
MLETRENSSNSSSNSKKVKPVYVLPFQIATRHQQQPALHPPWLNHNNKLLHLSHSQTASFNVYA